MASHITESLTVTTVQARKALLVAFKNKRPVFLWGPPGIGKSEIVAEVAKELGGIVCDMRLAQCQPDEIRGVPFFNRETGKMDWAPPVDLPDEALASQYPIIVLFLDEMNSASSMVQAAAYQLVLNRRIGKYVLPDNVVIVAAGNRDSDRGVTYRMPMPLANRFCHLEMRADFDSWQSWAVNNNIHKDVVGYLSFAKNDMYDFDSKSASRAFATPRSWVFVSELLQDSSVDTDTLFNLTAGCIGEGLAIKFMAHRKVSDQMPNPVDVLQGKVKDLKIKEISAMYSLTIAMCYELKNAVDNKTINDTEFHEQMDNCFTFAMENFETELVVLTMRIAFKTYKLPVQPSKLKTMNTLYKKYDKYITESVK